MSNEVKAQNTIDLTSLKELDDAVKNTDQYFWHTNTDTGAGAGSHITQIPQADFLERVAIDPTDGGGNTLLSALGMTIRKGLKEFASFLLNGLTIKTYDSRDNEVVIAHLGYGQGVNPQGGTEEAPYYTLGQRDSVSDIGNYSMAEGYNTSAEKFASHAEGSTTTASGSYSHAEGGGTVASGTASHAEGDDTYASGWASHASGYKTIADEAFQFSIGEYNRSVPTALFIIGNGWDGHRSNAFVVHDTGVTEAHGNIRAIEESSTGGVGVYLKIYNTDIISISANDYAGDQRHGIYSQVNSKWLLRADNTGKVWLNEVRTSQMVVADNVEVDNISINANSNTGDRTVSVAKTGYTPLIASVSLANASSSGTNVSGCVCYQQYLSGDTLHYTIRNYASGAAKVKMTARVLYVSSNL